jgi:hypothetical protein
MKANLSGSSACWPLLLCAFVSLAPIQSGRAQGSNSPPALGIEVSLPRIRLQWPTRPDVVYEVQLHDAGERQIPDGGHIAVGVKVSLPARQASTPATVVPSDSPTIEIYGNVGDVGVS